MSRTDGTLGRNLGLTALGVAAAVTALYVYSSRSAMTDLNTRSSSPSSSPSSSSRDSQVMRSVIDLLKSPITASRGLDITLRLTASSDTMSEFNKEGGMLVLTPLLSEENRTVRLKALWVAANMCMDPVIGEQLLLQGGLSSILREANLSNQSNSKGTEEDVQAQISSCALQALLNLSAQTRTQELLMETQQFTKTILKLAEGEEGEEGTEKKNPEVSSLQVQWQAVKILTNLSTENSTREILLDLGLGDLITRLVGETLVISGRKREEEGEAGKEERIRISGLMRYRLLQMLCNLIGSNRWLQTIRDSKPLQEHLRTLLNQEHTDEEKSTASLLISRSASTTAT